MSQVLTWPATFRGDYVLDVLVGGVAVTAMIDTGLVDPAQLVGFELAPTVFDRLQGADLLKQMATRTHHQDMER